MLNHIFEGDEKSDHMLLHMNLEGGLGRLMVSTVVPRDPARLEFNTRLQRYFGFGLPEDFLVQGRFTVF